MSLVRILHPSCSLVYVWVFDSLLIDDFEYLLPMNSLCQRLHQLDLIRRGFLPPDESLCSGLRFSLRYFLVV